MRATTTHLFRAAARLEEHMVRASMPKASAADAAPVFGYGRRTPVAVTPRAPRPLTFTMMEVAR